MTHFHWAQPWFFLLLPVLLYLCWRRAVKNHWHAYPFQGQGQKGLRHRFDFVLRYHLMEVLCFLAIAFLVGALARPQKVLEWQETSTEGVDILMTIDTSGSMEAVDFTIGERQATRLEAVQKVLAEFIQKRPADRLGLIVFGEVVFTQAPLTLDHDLLQELVRQLEVGMAGPKTAIGDALAVSGQRLQDLKAKSKVIILLTDGSSNAGQLPPEQATEALAGLGIKVYTVGVGSLSPQVPFLVDGLFGKDVVYQKADMDEKALQRIAEKTGGKYFRASDTRKLEEIYDEINQLEKTEAKVKNYREATELYPSFLKAGILLLLLYWILSETRFRRLGEI